MPAVVDSVVTRDVNLHQKKRQFSRFNRYQDVFPRAGSRKACSALTGATEELGIGKIDAQTLIVTGDEDKISPPDIC